MALFRTLLGIDIYNKITIPAWFIARNCNKTYFTPHWRHCLDAGPALTECACPKEAFTHV